MPDLSRRGHNSMAMLRELLERGIAEERVALEEELTEKFRKEYEKRIKMALASVQINLFSNFSSVSRDGKIVFEVTIPETMLEIQK